MNIDYKLIGKRIAHRRKSLGLKQSEVEERAEIGYKYLSSIERGLSIPSIEVVMRLAAALDTTPDTFLVGSARQETARWESVAQYLRLLDEKQLDTAESFLPGCRSKADRLANTNRAWTNIQGAVFLRRKTPPQIKSPTASTSKIAGMPYRKDRWSVL